MGGNRKKESRCRVEELLCLMETSVSTTKPLEHKRQIVSTSLAHQFDSSHLQQYLLSRFP